MRKFKLSYLYVLAFLMITNACKKNEEEPEKPRGKYAVGVIVVNEGNFTDADGSFSFFDKISKTSTQNIYQKANNEKITGAFQSMYTFSGKSYLIDQKGHKIVVVEAETFKYIATINAGLSSPRYMTVANGKGYVSNWGPFDDKFQTPNSFIAIIDLTNFVVTKTLKSANGVEGMISIDNKVYAAAAGVGVNLLQVIDAQKDTFIKEIPVANRPKLFTKDGNGKLWVLCNDYVQSNLVKIDFVTNKATLFKIASGAKSIVANGDGSSIYYLCSPWGKPSQIFKIGKDASISPKKPLIIGKDFYGLGVDPDGEIIYVGKSNGANNGTIIRYNAAGVELDNFASGRFPNGFSFRN